MQVDLIVAVHDLLAEYGLCCAGRDGEGEEGTFLKFAIKHLMALDVKLKSQLSMFFLPNSCFRIFFLPKCVMIDMFYVSLPIIAFVGFFSVLFRFKWDGRRCSSKRRQRRRQYGR